MPAARRLRDHSGAPVAAAVQNARYRWASCDTCFPESTGFGRLDSATDDAIIDQAAQMLGARTVARARAQKGCTGPKRQLRGPAQRPHRFTRRPSEQPDLRQTGLLNGSRTQKQPQNTATGSSPKLSWIEIRLVDEDGQPVPGAAYEIILPDGSIKSGSLNAKGAARYDQIPAGQCEVRFPELDAKEWQPA